jgi:hypothetical protein
VGQILAKNNNRGEKRDWGIISNPHKRSAVCPTVRLSENIRNWYNDKSPLPAI